MKEKKYQKKSVLSSNKGFTLIELIIVIAIMAIAVGLVTFTYVMVDNANVSKAANALDTAFNKARIQSMAKGSDAGQLEVWIEDGTLYYTIGNPVTEGPIAVNNARIWVSYTTADGTVSSIQEVSAEKGVFRFNSAGMVISDDWRYRTIGFTHGSRTVDVIFIPETGKHMTQLR